MTLMVIAVIAFFVLIALCFVMLSGIHERLDVIENVLAEQQTNSRKMPAFQTSYKGKPK